MSFYDDASLIMYPSGYKADKIYSLKPTDGSGDFDFTRASTATRVNADGLIESVATGVPRIDYTGGGCGKLLLEPSRTNSITYSEDFNNAAWLKSGFTLSSNTVIAPDGELTADRFSFSTTSFFTRQTLTVVAETEYTFSFYAKKGTATGVNFRIFDLSNSNNIAFIDYESDLIDSEWVRIQHTFTTPIGCVSLFAAPITDSSTIGNIDIWGAQLEQGYPTSYIPTAGATATRVADASSTTGLSSVINSSEGTLFTEISAFKNGGVSRRISIGDGSTNNRVSLEMDEDASTLKGFMSSGGTLVGQLEFVGIDQTDNLKIALTYSDSAFSLYINGVKRDTDTTITTTPIGLDRLFYSSAAGSLAFEGTQKQLMIFTTALTDAEAIQLTTL